MEFSQFSHLLPTNSSSNTATLKKCHRPLQKDQPQCREVYQQLYEALKSNEVTFKKQYAKSTQGIIKQQGNRFTNFCQKTLNLPDAVFDTETILIYLISKYHSRCSYPTIISTWHYLSIINKQNPSHNIDSEKIQNFLSQLNAHYTKPYHPKPIANMSDVKDILQFLWTGSTSFRSNRYRVQLALFILVSSLTGTRPGAILFEYTYQESLEYQELELYLEKGGTTQEANLVLMVAFHKRKGERHQKELKFPFRDLGDDPCLWPIILVIALALHDKAFEAKNLTSATGLMSLKIPTSSKSLQLRWKDKISSLPIFRIGKGVEAKPLPYNTMLSHLHRLGEDAGYKDNLTPYTFRRGAATAIDKITTASQANLILGHSRMVERQPYLSQTVSVDIQGKLLHIPNPSQDQMVPNICTIGFTRVKSIVHEVKKLSAAKLRTSCPELQKLEDDKEKAKDKNRNNRTEANRKAYFRAKGQLDQAIRKAQRTNLKERRKKYLEDHSISNIEQQLAQEETVDIDRMEIIKSTGEEGYMGLRGQKRKEAEALYWRRIFTKIFVKGQDWTKVVEVLVEYLDADTV